MGERQGLNHRVQPWPALPWMLIRLSGSGIAWGVFGGLAVRLYSGRRRLGDIDILVGPGSLERAAALLGAPIAVQTQGLVQLRRATRWGVDLCGDVVAAAAAAVLSFTLDIDMVRRRRLKLWRGLPLWVLSPEDTLVLKTITERDAPAGERDLADMSALLTRQRLDCGYLMWRAEVCGAAKRVGTVLESLGWGRGRAP